jgi:hypothetical protein
MTRDEAIQRINDSLGFRSSGNPLESRFIARLQEAQRDLEKGKTLPRFLLVEDFQFTLSQGDHTTPYPDDFARFDDDNLPHFTNIDTFLPVYLEFVPNYSDAVKRLITLQRPGEPQQTVLAPRIFVPRTETIDFITTADRNYNISMNYYRHDAVLSSNIENSWLIVAPDWLIGEAGERIARDLRDPDALELFQELKQKGRAAIFGDDIAWFESGGPVAMGSRF